HTRFDCDWSSDVCSSDLAAAATGLIGATQVAARVIVTVAGDRCPAVPLTAAVFALQGAAVLILLTWQQASGVLLAVVLLGAGREIGRASCRERGEFAGVA